MAKDGRAPGTARRAWITAATVLLLLGAATGAGAQVSDDVVRIGVLTDLSGPYADLSGKGSVVAAELAAADAGGQVRGKPIQIVSADHQNKPDIASAVARRWYEVEGVDAIVDLPVTAVAFAVQTVAREKSRTVMITAAATSDFTAKTCAPVSTHWADDTHTLTAGTARAVMQRGGRAWYFITVDHAFGAALQVEATKVIEASGGRVVGTSRHPIGATDFSSFIVQARTSGADVVALASVGNDFITALKQAHEFGLGTGTPTLTGFLTYITDINALGLEVAKNLTFTSSFYWDQSDAARAFARRFKEKVGIMPTKDHAAVYTAVRQYLHGVETAGTDEAVAANKAMRATPFDFFGRPASIRADGRVLFDATLYRVKTPAESKAPWDYYEAVRTIPRAEAFLPMNPACAVP
ncbi:ABC transporter substrate-binding protein [Chelatococcus reniformis]|uniref:ABC transporter substrate-binding protein n=1 Tax=Chelatococcus reniformis TaxID=1494448 RepID=A0A916UTW7_9HYPH|nr:ABC transporter substrate-binding protein [Chelatococcus reniformis]GGC88227.1 ABC transporter substrate-binding protein [Chelatococcus reniformis]